MVHIKILKNDDKKGVKSQLFKQGKQKPQQQQKKPQQQQQLAQQKKPQQQQLGQQKKSQQQQKTQLQFASSDEDSEEEVDDESVVDEDEIDDEELDDEELDDEELEDEDLEDEEELENEDEVEDESEDEGSLTKSPLKSLLKNASAKKSAALPTPAKNGTSDRKSILKGGKEESAKLKKKNVDLSSAASPVLVSKAPATPHPPSAKLTKAQLKELKKAAMEVDLPPIKEKKGKAKSEAVLAPAAPSTTSAKKRKYTADDASAAKSGPPQKLARSSDIISEEERRREERNKRSLFLKNASKSLRKTSELKALHPDVVSVRAYGAHAWLLFPSEAVCEKAYKQLRTAKVKGNSLDVDFCGAKAQNPQEAKRNLDLDAAAIDKKTLLLKGVPVDMSVEKLKILFPSAISIDVPKLNKKKPKHLTNLLAFVHFANEQDAHTFFKKSESLKIGGVPVEVVYARERHHDDE